MDRVTLALIIQEGSKIISEVIRNRDIFVSRDSPDSESPRPSTSTVSIEKASQNTKQNIATGCVPCSIGHLGTCTGLLNEAMRFARKDGVGSEEVIKRVNICLDELNALERVDLSPEQTNDLSDWEKELAVQALDLSRTVRHGLEGLSSLEDLEGIAAETQGKRQEIGKAWFQARLSRLTPGERQQVKQQLEQKVSLGQAKKLAAAAAEKEVEEHYK